MIVGQPIMLECTVTTVKGITDQVDIVWNNTNSGKEWKRENVNISMEDSSSVVYRDCFNISQLATNDNNVTYKCEVIINSSSLIMAANNTTLHVTGKSYDYIIPSLCIFSVVPDFITEISSTGTLQGVTVGNNQTIQCRITTASGVAVNSVMVTWIGPRGMPIYNSSRMIIIPVMLSHTSNSSINTFTSSLQFMYLMEGDEGTYVCNVSILQTNAFMETELGALQGRY